MDKETREMFNLVIAAIDKSEERTNRRFDALEQQIGVVKRDLQNVYETLHHEINGVKLNTEALDMRMECVETKVDAMDQRLGVVETKVDAMDQRLGVVETKVDAMDQRLGVVEQKVDSMNLILQPMHTHEPRIQALENEVFGKQKRTRRALWQP